MGGWAPDQPSLRRSPLVRSYDSSFQARPPRIGLVWMAEDVTKLLNRSWRLRLRDLPFLHLKERIPNWNKRFSSAVNFSLQIDTDHPLDGPVRDLVDEGITRHSSCTSTGDWLDTLELVETMDLVLTVDTAMAPLCGSVGVPCVWSC